MTKVVKWSRNCVEWWHISCSDWNSSSLCYWTSDPEHKEHPQRRAAACKWECSASSELGCPAVSTLWKWTTGHKCVLLSCLQPQDRTNFDLLITLLAPIGRWKPDSGFEGTPCRESTHWHMHTYVGRMWKCNIRFTQNVTSAPQTTVYIPSPSSDSSFQSNKLKAADEMAKLIANITHIFS